MTSDVDRELRRATLLYRLRLAAQLKRRTLRTIPDQPARSWSAKHRSTEAIRRPLGTP
jgi:hypothetical protein